MFAAATLSGQTLRYGIVGLINTGAGLSIIVAFHQLGLGLTLSNALGYLCGWLISYQLNRTWTFRHQGVLSRSLLAWALLVLLAFVFSLATVSGAMRLGLPYLSAQIAGVVLYSFIVFLGARHVVFARH